MTFAEVLNFLVRSGFGNGWLKWEVKEFCRRLGISTSLYYSWRKGGRPRNENLYCIVQLMELDAFFTKVLFSAVDGETVVDLSEMVYRRDVLKWGIATTGSVLSYGHSGLPAAIGRSAKIANALGSVLDVFGSSQEARRPDAWAHIVEGHSRAYYTTQPEALTVELAANIVVLRNQANQELEENAKRCLMGSLALLHGLMALCLTDLSQRKAASRWWSVAKNIADASGSSPARVWIRGKEAIELLYTCRTPENGLAVAEEALSIGDFTRAGSALAARAQALALLGRSREAKRAVQSIERTIASEALEDTETVFGWPESRLRHTESYVYSHIGDSVNAHRAQDRAMILYRPSKERPLRQSRALIGLHEGLCLLREGYVDDGCQAAVKIINKLAESDRSTFVYGLGRQILANIPECHQYRVPALELGRLVPTLEKSC